jgi:hypothetical protein
MSKLSSGKPILIPIAVICIVLGSLILASLFSYNSIGGAGIYLSDWGKTMAGVLLLSAGISYFLLERGSGRN